MDKQIFKKHDDIHDNEKCFIDNNELDMKIYIKKSNKKILHYNDLAEKKII